jgi:4-hydroxybenzoate polyprenyltransferase
LRLSAFLSKLADILFLVRPPLLCASSTFFFAGALSSHRAAGAAYYVTLMPEVVPNLLLFALTVSAAFVVNQVFDVESDAINRKAFILPSGAVSRAASLGIFCIICALAVAVSLYRETPVRYLVWLGLSLGLAYSVPPLRLKGRPILDLLANVSGFGLIGFALGWLAFGRTSLELWLRALPYALAMSGIFLNTCIPDEEGDRSVGDRTSCVAFGKTAVSRAALVCVCGSGLAGVLADEVLCSLAIVASLPGFVAVAVDPTSRTSVIASQFAARFLLVLVCIKAPLLGVFTLAIYLVSRAYYRRRFGLVYPNITGA